MAAIEQFEKQFKAILEEEVTEIKYDNGRTFCIKTKPVKWTVLDPQTNEITHYSPSLERLGLKVMNTIDNPRNSSRQFFLNKSDCEFLGIDYEIGLEIFAL